MVCCFECCFWVLFLSVCVVFESEGNEQRERQTNTERAKRLKDTEKETDQGIEAISREHTQEKRK